MESTKVEVEINATEISEFLEDLRPEGLQNLAAFHPTDKGALSKTFELPKELKDAVAWAVEQNTAGWNAYFAVNPAKRKINKKLKKTDMIAGAYCHADLDPDCSESYAAGRAQLMDRVSAKEFSDATFLIDTGNGIAPYYQLEEPLNEKETEEINTGLARLMGGDKCQNIDRVMRLPGTINYADPGKIARGYPEQTQASLLICEPDRMLTPALADRARKAAVEAPTAPDKPAATDADVDGVFLHALDDAELRAVAARLAKFLDGNAGLRDRWHGNTAGLTDTSRSGYDMSIVRALAGAKFTASEALAIMLSASAGDNMVAPFKHSHSAMADKAGDDRYFRRMWARTHANDAPTEPTKRFTFGGPGAKPDMDHLLGAKIRPPELIPSFLPKEVATLIGAGGGGKSTLAMWVSTCIAIGRPLFVGGATIAPRGVLYLSGEDGRVVIDHRLQEILKAADLDAAELALFHKNFYIEDVTNHTVRLVESDHKNINETAYVDELIEAYQGKNIQLVYLDTASLFGAGEDNSVNDAPVALIRACRKIGQSIVEGGACVCILHHTGKQQFRENSIDMYSGRGGSAGADNSRAVHVLVKYKRPEAGAKKLYTLPDTIDMNHPGAIEAGNVNMLVVAKYSYASCPQQPYWVVRDGFKYTIYEPMGEEEAENVAVAKQQHQEAANRVQEETRERGKRAVVLGAIEDMWTAVDVAKQQAKSALDGPLKVFEQAAEAMESAQTAVDNITIEADKLKNAKAAIKDATTDAQTAAAQAQIDACEVVSAAGGIAARKYLKASKAEHSAAKAALKAPQKAMDNAQKMLVNQARVVKNDALVIPWLDCMGKNPTDRSLRDVMKTLMDERLLASEGQSTATTINLTKTGREWLRKESLKVADCVTDSAGEEEGE